MLKEFELKDTPALIEYLFPVQKISVESFKEQMSNQSKTLTALGSYWKGRKPLVLNKACILGCLLPVSDNLLKDLYIFELLMATDNSSLAIRQGRIKPADVARRTCGIDTYLAFVVEPQVDLPLLTPFEINDYTVLVEYSKGKTKEVVPSLRWHPELTEKEILDYEAQALPFNSFKENVSKAKRAEEVSDKLYKHSWSEINEHLGTNANSMQQLVEQLGIARFGHRPNVADVFCGSGQIPFEAARLGCDVYASDLNPIACMLTWGAFNIVGASPEKRKEIEKAQQELIIKVQSEIDELEIETDGDGWQAKVFLYCVEVKCPQTGWKVPLIPSLIISKGYKVIAELIPVPEQKKYDIEIKYVQTEQEMQKASLGTIQEGYMVHSPDGKTIYRESIATIRGDYKKEQDGKMVNKNKLRLWEKSDFIPREDDIFQERLYCIQWMQPKSEGSKKFNYEFRAVTYDDLKREQKVIDYVAQHLEEWQENGLVPDMVIEKGYNTDQPIRERGWTHWHHLFNPRHIMTLGQIKKFVLSSDQYIVLSSMLDFSSKLSRWTTSGARLSKDGNKQIGGASNNTSNVFYNQALNTLYNWGCRSLADLISVLDKPIKSYPNKSKTVVITKLASHINCFNDIYITDPPYGDAVKYEEITEFFIAWLRKNPPKEFAHWTWDSRRSLAIKGEDESFRQSMVSAYRKMQENMPDNGIQVLMFTHQSGSIWADMANIVWASGLQVTAAWYVVTETDSALRQGANVTGTVLLVLRKRHKELITFREDLGWEIKAAVEKQVEKLSGLDREVRNQTSEGLYNDADMQMAGYAAALKVLTAYSTIDGKDMVLESTAPRIQGKKTFVDEMIDFAVQTAVEYLVPVGFEPSEWQKLKPIERFYLKMTEIENQGEKKLDNYQNFAKAFKVRNFSQIMSDKSKANSARLKLSTEFKASLMAGDAELANTPLRALLYAIYEISKDTDVDDVISHLIENCPNYMTNKNILAKMANYLAEKRDNLKPTKTYKPNLEASSARILAEAIANQRL